MKTRFLSIACVLVLRGTCQVDAAAAEEAGWSFKDEFWPGLARSVPVILKSQDPKTGRFGSGIWIVTDQNVMFPLATAWSVRHPRNPHHHRDDLLEAIMAGDKAAVESLIGWCRHGPPAARVKRVDVQWKADSSRYSGFDVVY